MLTVVSYFLQDKRKISMDNMIQQPPLKKLVTDGPAGAVPSNSLPGGMQGASSGYTTNLGTTERGFASMPQALSSENLQRISSRKEMTGAQVPKSQVGHNQAWKQDIDAAHLLPFLFEYYGESMLSFVSAPELSIFL